MLENAYFYAFIGGGAFLVIQLILMLFGEFSDGGADSGDVGDGGFDGDLNPDHGADASHRDSWIFEVISMRTLAAAATFFGLAGMAARQYELSSIVTLVIAVAAGLAAMYAVYWLFKQVFRLESSGSQDIRNAVGLAGEVYLRVPANGQGVGKVHLAMQGRTVEYLAVTDEPDTLPTGSQVIVSGIVNGDTLRVNRETSLVTTS
jgi:hypothetical protein